MKWLRARPRLVLAGSLVLVWITASLVHLSAQATGSLLERFTQMSRQAESSGLAEPFKGITADGTIQPGLFAVRSTGVSTDPVRVAADRVPGLALGTAAPEDDVRGGRLGVAEVDEPALLYPAGRELQGDERRAA